MRVILMLLLMVCTVVAGAGAVPISPQPQPAPAAPDATPASPAATPPADAAKAEAKEVVDVVLGLFPDFLNKKRGIILESIQNIADAIDERLAQANKVFYQGSAGFIVLFVAV